MAKVKVEQMGPRAYKFRIAWSTLLFGLPVKAVREALIEFSRDHVITYALQGWRFWTVFVAEEEE